VVTSIGRLDKDTSGALLITDCGSLVQRLTSPRAQIDKVYVAEVEGNLRPELIEIFASGQLQLRNEPTPCLPAKLEILQPQRARLTLQEGRYHQVRRMFAAQGLRVTQLHRESFAGHGIEHLSTGQWQLLPLPEGHQRIA
jgi:16S rRNA pseudouridine516 synthase